MAAILIVTAVALFVAAPLSSGFSRRRRSSGGELDRLEHERGLAVQGLRELEFDHEMGKLDEVDYRDLKRALEGRALSAMSAIERLRATDRTRPMWIASRPVRPSPAPASAIPAAAPQSARAAGVKRPRVNFCPQCGVRTGAGHSFCASCGASLSVAVARAPSRVE